MMNTALITRSERGNKMFGRKKIHVENEVHETIQLEEKPVLMQPKNDDIKKTLLDINALLLYMTGLDYVSEMIFLAGEQGTAIHDIAKNSTDLASATDDIAHHVESSSASMVTTTQETERNLEEINQTFRIIEENIAEMNNAGRIMEEVSEQTEKINELVNVIKDVATQTNLLSLNASIEAARAGTAGKGFSVVANEIKKLAENTKQQVDVIQSIVSELSNKIGQANAEIERVVTSFSGSKDSIDSAIHNIGGIADKLTDVNDNFASISANVEEQSATTQHISGSIQQVNDHADDLLARVEQTGKAFFDISMKLFDIRALASAEVPSPDVGTMVELIKADHLMWKWRVYNMILGYVKLEEKAVGDHTACRLGKWILTLDRNNKAVDELVARIEKPHAGVHQNAKKAIQEYNKGNTDGAKEFLKALDSHSREVVELIEELGKALGK